MKGMIAACTLVWLLLGLVPAVFGDNSTASLSGVIMPSPNNSSFASTQVELASPVPPAGPVRSASGTGNPPKDGSGNSSQHKFDKKDIPRALQYAAKEKRVLAPVRTRPGPAPANPNYVQPLLFVPSDVPETPENAPAIAATLELLRRWYSGALELNKSGYVFRLSDTVTYHAREPFSYYKCPNHEPSCDNYDGVWGNVQSELLNAGYPLWAAGTSFVVFVKGAGGWAGGNCIPNCGANWPAPGPAAQAGLAVLGDWALDAITGVLNDECYANLGSACYQDPQRGAVGHELGHTFGLNDPQDQYSSIMYSWWDFPNESLMGEPGNDEKGLLRSDSAFFSPYGCNPDAYGSQVALPAVVSPKSQFAGSLTFINYGFCHWAAGTAELRVVDANVWGVRTQQLGQDLYPAQSYTFSLWLAAPSLPVSKPSRIYGSYWQMHAPGGYFGQQAGTSVTVSR